MRFSYLYNTFIFTKFCEGKKIEFPPIKNDHYTYDEVIQYYLEIFQLICENTKAVEHDKFIKLINSYENILNRQSEYGIHIDSTTASIKLSFNKSSKIDLIKDDINNFVNDKLFIKNLKLGCLSDAEESNLSLYTSIDLQINQSSKNGGAYILFFDEIERSMHPEMCRNLISDLIAFLALYKNKTFQIILASHSPFITSDIPKENIICLKRQGQTIKAERCEIETFGQNIHTILRNEFFMDSTMGNFARNTILQISKQLESSTKLSKEDLFKIEIKIGMIGEPIIKTHLVTLLDNYRNTMSSKEEQIAYYKFKLEEAERRKC